jgi:hypothetical protein
LGSRSFKKASWKSDATSSVTEEREETGFLAIHELSGTVLFFYLREFPELHCIQIQEHCWLCVKCIRYIISFNI